jgi:hypothetical protein
VKRREEECEQEGLDVEVVGGKDDLEKHLLVDLDDCTSRSPSCRSSRRRKGRKCICREKGKSEEVKMAVFVSEGRGS